MMVNAQKLFKGWRVCSNFLVFARLSGDKWDTMGNKDSMGSRVWVLVCNSFVFQCC